MSKSAIYTVNTNSNSVATNGIIPLGSVARRFGCNLGLNGNAIFTEGNGYYEFEASINVTPLAVGNVTVTLYKDGVPVQGATATGSVSTVGNTVNLGITALVRECCCNARANYTLVLTGNSSTVNNVAVVVKKL